MKSQKRYKVINNTIKAPRRDPKSGKDLRPLIEKIGYNISIGPQGLTPKPPRNFTILSDLDEGVLKLYNSGLVRIEEIEDFATLLKKHAAPTSDDVLHEEAPAAESMPEPEAPAPVEVPKAEPKRAHAVEMGKDERENQEKHAHQEIGSENSDAVNPDGKPNFQVTAESDHTRGKRGGKKGRKNRQQSEES
jgi:hypothetical protein